MRFTLRRVYYELRLDLDIPRPRFSCRPSCLRGRWSQPGPAAKRPWLFAAGRWRDSRPFSDRDPHQPLGRGLQRGQQAASSNLKLNGLTLAGWKLNSVHRAPSCRNVGFEVANQSIEVTDWLGISGLPWPTASEHSASGRSACQLRTAPQPPSDSSRRPGAHHSKKRCG